MGVSGCDLAKDASDIVVMDDNFKSVFRAFQWGRNIYDNIRKFLQFQITVTVVCVFVVLVGGTTLGESPFNVVELLWINMVMDTLAALALATEPPVKDQFQAKLKKSDKIILPVMVRNIMGQSIYMIMVMMTLLYFGPLMFGINYDYVNTSFYGDDYSSTNKQLHYTLMFQTFMMMQLFNEFNSRKLGPKEYNIFKGLWASKYFMVIVAAQFAI
jgi:magnesium-transporting ATPase (P-type)